MKKALIWITIGGVAVAGTVYVLFLKNKKPTALENTTEKDDFVAPEGASNLSASTPTPAPTAGVNPKIEEPLKVFQTGNNPVITTPQIKLQDVAQTEGLQGLAKTLDEQNRDRQAQIILDKLKSPEAEAIKGKAWTYKSFALALQKYLNLKKSVESQLLAIGYKLVGGEYKKLFGTGTITPTSAVRI